jgi:cytochrome b6-f complex iron-sulfur subunit
VKPVTEKTVVGLPRRRFLGQGFGLLGACFCLPLLDLLAGCQQEDGDPAPGPVSVPVAMLSPGKRITVEVAGQPVELLRTESGVTARSLRCTHQGCKVKWHEAEQQYICPCHEGKFDADGQVVYGMPRRPLAVLTARIEGNQVIVDP